MKKNNKIECRNKEKKNIHASKTKTKTKQREKHACEVKCNATLQKRTHLYGYKKRFSSLLNHQWYVFFNVLSVQQITDYSC